MVRKNIKRKTPRFYKRKARKRKSGKLLEISIIFVMFLILIYAFSSFKKISQSEATSGSTQGKELIPVRIQVLNGSQEQGLARNLADRLRGLNVGNIVYDVVQIGNFECSEVEESFIMDRTADEGEANPSEIALLTAQTLGIEKKSVLCKKLKDNYEGIELTIVIGQDHERLFEVS